MERCRRLLRELGLNLKDQPEEEYLVDLRSGKTTDLLGFRVFSTEGTIRYGITDTAYDSLRANLREAHESTNPAKAADAVITGWISSCGPAVDSSPESDVIGRVLSTARRQGFRETDPGNLSEVWGKAGDRWRRTLHHYRAHQWG